MSYSFKRLSEIEVAEQINEDDEVLIIQDGEIKRTNKVKGGSECKTYVYYNYQFKEGDNSDIMWDDSVSYTPCRNIMQEYKNGTNIKVYIPYNGKCSSLVDAVGIFDDEYSYYKNGIYVYDIVYGNVIQLYDNEVING